MEVIDEKQKKYLYNICFNNSINYDYFVYL